MAYKHRSAGSITLVGAPPSAASSTDSFKSIPPALDADAQDVTDARSVFDEDTIDPILRHSTYLSPSNLDLEKGIDRSTSTRTGHLPNRKGGPSTASTDQDQDPSIVTFESEDDPLNPQNFTFRRKCAITFILAGLTFSTTFTSSVFSAAIPATSTLFSLSTTVMTLGTSLNLLGWTIGPIIWGPFSELYGRRPPLIIGVGGMCLMQVGVGVSQNAYTIFLCRFFGGVLGVAPLCVVGGALADFWDPVQRGVAVGIYAMCTFIGPVAAPILGGYVAQSHLGWRWTQYISVILIGVFWSVALVFLPETSHAQILQAKAKRVRFETKDWSVHAPADEKKITVRVVVERYLTRPFRMLGQEPILVSLCLYIGLTYGILYLFLTSYPISFEQERGWSQGKAGLPFLAITIGVILGGLLNSYYSITQFRAKLAAQQEQQQQQPSSSDTSSSPPNEKSSSPPSSSANSSTNASTQTAASPPPSQPHSPSPQPPPPSPTPAAIAPEARLPPMILGSLLLPPGLLWWAWRSSPSISPWPQILSGIPMGAGILLILVNGLNYLVDVYKHNSNSAIAANTFIRCSFGAAFPMFAGVFYERVGTEWATTVLGVMAAVVGVGPVVFWKWGVHIRGRSRFVLEE